MPGEGRSIVLASRSTLPGSTLPGSTLPGSPLTAHVRSGHTPTLMVGLPASILRQVCEARTTHGSKCETTSSLTRAMRSTSTTLALIHATVPLTGRGWMNPDTTASSPTQRTRLSSKYIDSPAICVFDFLTECWRAQRLGRCPFFRLVPWLLECDRLEHQLDTKRTLTEPNRGPGQFSMEES